MKPSPMVWISQRRRRRPQKPQTILGDIIRPSDRADAQPVPSAQPKGRPKQKHTQIRSRQKRVRKQGPTEAAIQVNADINAPLLDHDYMKRHAAIPAKNRKWRDIRRYDIAGSRGHKRQPPPSLLPEPFLYAKRARYEPKRLKRNEPVGVPPTKIPKVFSPKLWAHSLAVLKKVNG